MNEDYLAPTFRIEIEGKHLSKDITQEITSFIYEDNEEELDVMEASVTDRYLQFADDPLLQEGNEITARFGYAGNLSVKKVAVIKEIDYDFPENGEPTIHLKAYDKGHRLTGRQIQRVWQRSAPGILYSEIAEKIAAEQGLIPVVTKTVGRHLRVVQGNLSDAQFLKGLAAKARNQDGKGAVGYVFYVQDNELHFHPKRLEQRPAMILEYFTDRQGILRSFRPSTQSQFVKGAGTETKAVGVDPRKKCSVEQKANNSTTSERTVLGNRTYLVDGNTGETRYRTHESGRIVPDYGHSSSQCEKEHHHPLRDRAESHYKTKELRQVEATATTLGIPTLAAKQNIEIRGVGRKFSGIYYCTSVRHQFEDGYSCELKLRRNALGKGAGTKASETKGKKNEHTAPRHPTNKVTPHPRKEIAVQQAPAKPRMIKIDANTGKRLD